MLANISHKTEENKNLSQVL